MHAVDRIAWKAFEEAVREHGLGASPAFLGRLEDRLHCAGKISVLRQLPRSPKQHGDKAVMAASMHAARIGQGIGETRLLGQREGVHVGAQADSSSAGGAPARSLPLDEFSSLENAIDTRLSFRPFVNMFGFHSFKRR
jgi:hypothetical protein